MNQPAKNSTHHLNPIQIFEKPSFSRSVGADEFHINEVQRYPLKILYLSLKTTRNFYSPIMTQLIIQTTILTNQIINYCRTATPFYLCSIDNRPNINVFVINNPTYVYVLESIFFLGLGTFRSLRKNTLIL